MRTLTLPASFASRGPLVLVNGTHPLGAPPSPSLTAPAAAYPDILLESRAALALRACVEETASFEQIVPVSGWRSGAKQREIWDSSLAGHGEAFTRRYVAYPGCSEHETGLAVDLGAAAERIDFLRPDFPYDGVSGVFRRTAAKFGFVERYPAGREHITGIAHEPWHFRYVGCPHAAILAENRLCLEEYGPFLRENPQTRRLANGQRVSVSCLPRTGGKTAVLLPDGPCQISGYDGESFILTVWEAES